MTNRIAWQGVFPAVTTQFRSDFSLDLDATRRVMDALIRDGVSGLIVCGTVGENTSLTRSEKIAVMEVAKDVAAGRVPVISGIAEFTTPFAIDPTPRRATRCNSYSQQSRDCCERVYFLRTNIRWKREATALGRYS
jgi:4-hydroxy-tetrahydrodipicolinate synthase